MTEEIHEGGCVCGAIRFRTKGPPRRAFVCHCTYCQRASGSAFVAEALFLKEAVEMEGEPISTYEHRSDETGRALYVEFCPRCSARVGMRLEWVPELRGVFVGTFDDPDWVEIDRHIFARSALKWVTYPENVQVYQKHWLY
jgi:hypothetical protein